MGTGISTSDGTLTDCREMIDLTRSPFIVIWQVIRACALACAHCQAEAIPRRNPGELSALVLNYGDVFSGHYRSH